MKYFQEKTGRKTQNEKENCKHVIGCSYGCINGCWLWIKRMIPEAVTQSLIKENPLHLWRLIGRFHLMINWMNLQKETGIEVEVSEVGWDDIREKLATAATGNKNVADVVEVD